MTVRWKSHSSTCMRAIHTDRSVTGGPPRSSKIQQRRRDMSDLVFILLTVAIFALLGLIVKAVERL
jgi:hypothetical protein